MDTPKRHRGRPRAPDPASGQIHLRVTPAEKAKYQRAAEQAKTTLTGWIKALMDRESS
jgi:predicted HicB family RNase H-like nuclease